MVRRIRAGRLQCVVIDLNTQVDFLNPQGGYPIVNLEELLPTLRRLVAWSKRNYAPVVSSIDSHRICELNEEHQPTHCVDGSPGQRKIDFTLFPKHERVEFDNTLCVPLDLFQDYQQIIFRKRENDLLGNPKADRFLTQLNAKEFVLFGVGLECSIKMLALGLLARRRRVTVVSDGCGYWNKAQAELALRQISAKGANLITVDELLRRKLSRTHRYPIHVSEHGQDSPAHRGNGRGRYHNRRGGNGT